MGRGDRNLIDRVRSHLARGHLSAEALCADMQISQPTLSRTIQNQHDVIMFREPGIRTPKYAATRIIAGIDGGQNVYRIDAEGKVRDFGVVWFLAGGYTLFVEENGPTQLYGGLAPWLNSARLSGYVGRSMAAAAPAALMLPKSLRDWSDDHHLTYVFTQAPDLPGDIVFGDWALDQHMAKRASGGTRVSRVDYSRMATGLIAQSVGSSAGGEQPKFVCENEEYGHLIVKFAQNGTRSADLLRLECLALSVLGEHGVESASAQIFTDAGYTFLESQRFDRIGRHGRRGVIPIGVIDDELFGARDTWQQFATRCSKVNILSNDDVHTIHKMAAYSQFIGNTDTHFENLSLLTNGNQVIGVAPAYDILPMKYAPIGGGIDPPLTPIEPRLSFVAGNLHAWSDGCAAALDFWMQAKDLPDLKPEFKSVALVNIEIIDSFLANLPHREKGQDHPSEQAPRM